MTEVTWFIYGFICGVFYLPALAVIRTIVREFKVAKQEWRKDGRSE